MDAGLKLDVVVKILMDSGMPLENLVGKEKKKKAGHKKEKDAAKGEKKTAVAQKDDKGDPITKEQV